MVNLIIFFLCENLLLKPKNFKSKKIQKNRIFKNFKNNFFLKFGNIGIFLLKPILISSTNILKIKLILKKSTKKKEKTRRKFWFSCFPHLPLSKKFLGSRMGKGKGKLNSWYLFLTGGLVILEIKNIRIGRFFFFYKLLSFFFSKKNIILFKSSFFFKLPFKNKNFKI